MSATYTNNYAGMREMLRSDEMEAAMLAAADIGKAVAEGIAPVDTGGPHPGRYRGAFYTRSGKHDDRAYAVLENDADEAQFVEYGTENNPAHHTLMRAIGGIGGAGGIARTHVAAQSRRRAIREDFLGTYASRRARLAARKQAREAHKAAVERGLSMFGNPR